MHPLHDLLYYVRDMEVSNNVLAALAMVVMAVSVGGTASMLSLSVPSSQPVEITGMDTLTQTGIANVTLSEETAIELVVQVVDFGTIAAATGTQNDTTDYSPHPFVIKNNGSVVINVSIAESTSQALWSQDNACEHCFQFNSTHNVSASDAVAFYDWRHFNETYWAENASAGDVNADTANLVYNLSNGAFANVNLNITVPASESAGLKTATIFFKAFASAS